MANTTIQCAKGDGSTHPRGGEKKCPYCAQRTNSENGTVSLGDSVDIAPPLDDSEYPGYTDSEIERIWSLEPSTHDAELKDILVEKSRAAHSVQWKKKTLKRFREDQGRGAPGDWDTKIANQLTSIKESEEELSRIDDRLAPYEDRYADERWSRAWLVTNAGGHVHKDTQCSTCFPTTQYDLVTEMSGKDEDYIVSMAGEGACTVCYPDAPVNVLSSPRRMKSEDEKEAEARKREAAKKRSEKNAKLLFDPMTGEHLTAPGFQVLKTERSAMTAAVNELDSDFGDYLYSLNDPNMAEYRDSYRKSAERAAELSSKVAWAISEKRRVDGSADTSDPAEIHRELIRKAIKKHKAGYGTRAVVDESLWPQYRDPSTD